jgi:hypothetical protein
MDCTPIQRTKPVQCTKYIAAVLIFVVFVLDVGGGGSGGGLFFFSFFKHYYHSVSTKLQYNNITRTYKDIESKVFRCLFPDFDIH